MKPPFEMVHSQTARAERAKSIFRPDGPAGRVGPRGKVVSRRAGGFGFRLRAWAYKYQSVQWSVGGTVGDGGGERPETTGSRCAVTGAEESWR